MNTLTTHHAIDRDFANRSRTARGFSSFKDWQRQNRRAFKDFINRAKRRGTSASDSERFRRLASTLEVEYMTLIRPFI